MHRPLKIVVVAGSGGSHGRRTVRSARLWFAVAAASARRHTALRAGVAGAAFANIVFGILRGYVLLAVWRERPGLAGLDAADAVTFTVVGQAVGTYMAVFGGSIDLPMRIISGHVVADLTRPVGFTRWWLGQEAGRALAFGVTRGLPAVAVGAAVFRLRTPPGALAWLAFAGTLVVGLLVSFGIRYLVALSAFWLFDDRGVAAVVTLASTFFSGSILPLALFPGAFGTFARALPFAATLQVPMEVFLGQARGCALLAAIGSQLLWAGVLLTAASGVTRAAYRRVVVQGG